MTKHLDRDNRRFDDESNTRPTGSNYISVDRSDDGLDRRGFLRCMAWAATATVWALSGGIPKSFAIGRAGPLSESEKKSILFAQVSDSHIGFNKEANTNVTATLQRFSVTFAKPGAYSYFCSLHPKMQGKVVVTAGD